MKKFFTTLFTVKKTLIGLGVLVFGGFLFFSEKEAAKPVEIEVKEKFVEGVVFGNWQPSAFRHILATVESDQDASIITEVAGTVENVLVRIGEEVEEGAALATLAQVDDPTQIGFENAEQHLEVTRLSTENNVRSAQIALETARRDLSQARLNETQSTSQVFNNLKIYAQNSETLVSEYVNWVDGILGVSATYRYKDSAERSAIGMQDTIGRQDAKNLLESLLRSHGDLSFQSYKPSESEILDLAKERLELLETTKKLALFFDRLIHISRVTTDLSEDSLDSFKSVSAAYLDELDGEILTLESQIETAKTQRKGSNLSLISAENTVKNSDAALGLARANAAAQVSAAENQYRLAQNSQKDLTIRAPFSGKISEKFISVGDQVGVGSAAFALVNKDASGKVVAYLTARELADIRNSDEVKLEFANGETAALVKNFSSVHVNPQNQKIKVELPLERVPENVFMGGFARILLSVNGTKSDLLPVSAVSFEPGGAEVLVVAEGENVARRRAVEVGEIVANAIEVVAGIGEGEKVVRFRNQVHSGETVKIIINDEK